MTTGVKSEEQGLPRFPALHMCVVIDARHGSRVEIVKDIKSSTLFEEVIEAQSLRNGLQLLDLQNVDALILGPSVSPVKAAAFIERGKQSVSSSDCAFIATINAAEGAEAAAKGLYAAGAHAVIIRPCTKMVFTEGIIRGVVAANANGAWAGILLSAEAKGLDMFGNVIVKRGAPQLAALGGVKVVNTAADDLLDEPAVVAGSLAAVLQKTQTIIRELMTGAESGQLSLDPEGKPTQSTARAINAIIQKGTQEIADDPKLADARTFYSEALTQWFVDFVQLSQRDASERLRERLLRFTTPS